MKLRFFGQDVSAHATYDPSKLGALLDRIGSAVDEPHHEAAVVLHGLHPAVVQARAGRILDRDAAGQAIVGALAAFGRGNAVPLPTKVDEPTVTGPMLARAAAQARLAVSAPVTLVGVKRLSVPRWKIALALELPKNGATKLRIGGPGADALFKSLQKQVNTKAHDAQFVVTSGGIRDPAVHRRARPRRAEDGRGAARRGAADDQPVGADRGRVVAAEADDGRCAGDGDHRPRRRATRRPTAASRTGSTTSSSSPTSSTTR